MNELGARRARADRILLRGILDQIEALKLELASCHGVHRREINREIVVLSKWIRRFSPLTQRLVGLLPQREERIQSALKDQQNQGVRQHGLAL